MLDFDSRKSWTQSKVSNLLYKLWQQQMRLCINLEKVPGLTGWNTLGYQMEKRKQDFRGLSKHGGVRTKGSRFKVLSCSSSPHAVLRTISPDTRPWTHIPAFAWKARYIFSSETLLLLHQPHIFIYSSAIFSHSEMKRIFTARRI